jgi:hippurate hydrolase
MAINPSNPTAAKFSVPAKNSVKFKAAKQSGERLPSLHSSLFAPDREPTLKTAILAESTMVLSLLGPGK